jgi:colanic acid/amylovoran biosynthesis glycosyltransferase
LGRVRRKLRTRDYLKKLEEVSKRVDADIIHSHFGNVGWTNLDAIRKVKARHVVTFYGLDVNQLPVKYPVWRKRYKRLFAEADLFLCEGTHMGRCLVELGCPAHKIKVQHLGVDVDSIVFRPRQWSPADPLRVLIAASFREKKGIPYAIQALQEVAKNTPLQLTIIGDAGQDPDSQKEKGLILTALERSGLKESTRMLGYQPHQVMLQEAYNHHLFLQPSVTAADGDTEGGAPVAIIEMLATGMPVVATTHCDIPEVVGPAFSHLLAPERDVGKLAECIERLLDKPGSWSDLIQKGREHVELEYHLVRQAERLISLYSELIGDVPPA